MESFQSRVEIIITEAQTPHETENYWEKEEYDVPDKKSVETVSPEELEEARREAQHIVADVITKATELVRNGDVRRTKHVPEKEERGRDDEANEDEEDGDKEDENEVQTDEVKELMKKDPQVVNKAKAFVCELLEKAVDEANKRLERRTQIGNSEVCLQDEINDSAGSVPSVGTKRKPWYRRASTSVCRFFHRVCLCVCNRNNR